MGGRLTRYFSFHGTTEGLKKFFPTLRPARTYNDLTNPSGNGVLALPNRDEVVVRIDDVFSCLSILSLYHHLRYPRLPVQGFEFPSDDQLSHLKLFELER